VSGIAGLQGDYGLHHAAGDGGGGVADSVRFPVGEKRAIIEATKQTINGVAANSTDPEMTKVRENFDNLCSEVETVINSPNADKPGFFERTFAAFLLFIVSIASLDRLFGGTITDFLNDLENVGNRYQDAQNRENLFNSFTEIVEKIPEQTLKAMSLNERANLLLPACIISPELAKQWIGEMPICAHDRIIGPELGAYLQSAHGNNVDEIDNLSPDTVLALREMLSDAAPAFTQREQVPISNLRLTGPIVPGDTISRGAFARDLSILLNGRNNPEYTQITVGPLVGRYQLYPDTMSTAERRRHWE
jgi:hypothetical protein